MTSPLRFDDTTYQSATTTVDGVAVTYRYFTGLTYVAQPVDDIQKLNVFVPEAYFNGQHVNGYNRVSAPIFMPNTVGGYMPGPRDYPRNSQPFSRGETILKALKQGYVVVSAGVRGRTQTNFQGEYIGKAPAFIVDMKAAVRYVKFNAGRLPGDPDKIITNGTSAGGATSALMGASGNADFFDTPLLALGAAPATDDVFAVSAYCPIHNLEHADAAYEWEFSGIYQWHRQKIRVVNNRRICTPVHGKLTPAERRLSPILKADFSGYLNELHLTDDIGRPLTLTPEGNGSFKDVIIAQLRQSAQEALTAGVDVTKYAGVTVVAGQVTDLNWDRYLRSITRMKGVPAFDTLDLSSPEADLFGSRLVAAKHFTPFAQDHTAVTSQLADADLVAAIDPLTYLLKPQSHIAQHWRIRHGAADRDTSFAIPMILATKLKNNGKDVDFTFPWATPHSGDYDLPELFSWIDNLCQPR
ncbi:subtype B tannase [Levilactobacillus fujinensis]|uniref:Subtype B tannase n=1 Tax=Levilactobacillus fujinensis TaxID=2486024 RepID=A0ABW1TJG5_9LACO|nr:subtype B tannase [Levilactobacillus fujinensis]